MLWSLYIIVTYTITWSVISYRFRCARNDTEVSIWLFGLQKAKEKASFGQVVEQKLKLVHPYLSSSNVLHIFTSLFCVWSVSLLLLLELECKNNKGKDFLSALLTTIWPMLELCLAHNRYLIIICSKNECISKQESNN